MEVYDCKFCDGTGRVDENGDAVYEEENEDGTLT